MSTESTNDFEANFFALMQNIKKIGLDAVNIEDSLAWGQTYGNFLARNHSSRYRDDDFEVSLTQRCLDQHSFAEVTETSTRELHIITTPLAVGGHTRLMEKLVNFRPESDILVTQPITREQLHIHTPDPVNVLYKASGFSLLELIEIIGRYKIIFLHINPDDLRAAVAVGVAKNIHSNHVVFINHADHIFSFGYACSDLVAEVSYYGMQLSAQKSRGTSTFLGIPINLATLQPIEPSSAIKDAHSLNFFTAANGNKFKPTPDYSFQRLATKILSTFPNARITVVGSNLWTDWWWWKVKILNLHRLQVLPSLPYLEYLAALKNAHIYLDSLPMTGGTALPEVRSKNIPVIGLITGSSGYTPFDATRYENAEALVAAIKNTITGQGGDIFEPNNDSEVIQAALDVHGFEHVAARLAKAAENTAVIMPQRHPTPIDTEFFRNTWIANGIVSIGLPSFLLCIKQWNGGGRQVLLYLLCKFGIKEYAYFCSLGLKIFARIFRSLR